MQIGVGKISVAAKPVETVKNELERPKPEGIQDTSKKLKERISRTNFKAFSSVLSARSKVFFGFQLPLLRFFLFMYFGLSTNFDFVHILGCLWSHQQAKGSSSGYRCRRCV